MREHKTETRSVIIDDVKDYWPENERNVIPIPPFEGRGSGPQASSQDLGHLGSEEKILELLNKVHDRIACVWRLEWMSH